MTARAVIGAVLAAALLGAVLQVPAVTRLLPPCPVAAVTGLHCPGCGSVRALAALARGDVAAAAARNPLLLAVLPGVGAMALLEARARRRGERLVLPRGMVGVIVAVIALFAVLRNLPGFGILGP